ncbi:MAG: (2Fe-2S)-binding protein [Coprothermobacterota bacterium]|nr:(2Fe-2S)-binding protein [Coprothermobacterota bacterium]
MKKRTITLIVNGETFELTVVPNELLLNVLRDRLHLTGTKYGCGVGECGSCTVLLNGKATLACMTLVVSVDGKEITTVEGLGRYDALHPLQQAFLDHSAVQCGFCTPGVLVTAKALLDENPHPSEEEIRQYLRGNLCRCTGYTSIVRAIEAVSKEAGF